MLIKAELISQQPQSSGYWLIQLKLQHDTPLAIGSRLEPLIDQPNLLHQAWLFSQHRFNINLLSDQSWQDLAPNQTITFELQQANFEFNPQPQQLWLGQNLSQAAVFNAAKHWQSSPHPRGQFVALLGADEGFSFQQKPARFMLNFAPQAIAASALLEDFGVPNRLATPADLPGCWDGDLTELYQAWLQQHHHQAWTIYGWVTPDQRQTCLQLTKDYPNINIQLLDA